MKQETQVLHRSPGKFTSEVLGVGLDVGYGELKGFRRGMKPVEEPAAVSELSGTRGGWSEGEPNFALVEKEEGNRKRQFFVGNAALEYGDVRTGSVDSSYITSEKYRVLGLYVLDRLAGKNPASLVTGLPVEFFAGKAGELKQAIQGWHRYGFDIRGIEVLPQPIGALTDLGRDWDWNRLTDVDQEGRIGIVDIGRGTVDCIEANKGRMHPTIRGGRNEGVSMMHDELYQYLMKHKPDYMPERSEIPGIMRAGGVEWYGEWVNLDKPITRIKKAFMERLVTIISEVWPRGTARLRRIVFTGGGAAALEEYLREGHGKAFGPNQVLIPDNPVQANAIGFAKIATIKARQG